MLCDPSGKCCIDGSDEDRAIIDRALQELAKPEQEPVATVKFIHNKKAPDVDWHCNICIRDGAKLYTAPPRKEWVGLTDDEIWECQKPGLSDDVYKLIEAKLKDKNEPSC